MISTDKIKKRSRQGAFISATGFLIIILVFVFAAKRLNSLNNIIELKTVQIDSLDVLLEGQKRIIRNNKDSIDNLNEEINKLKDPTVTPKAKAVMIPEGFTADGKQMFDFTAWVTASDYTLNKIKEVIYYFDEESFYKKERKSSDQSNGFLVSYRGWGCLTIVTLKIVYKDGNTENIYFNMCENIFSDSN
jgi:hypothetical protein